MKYQFRKYNPKYKVFYQKEKVKLKKILPKDVNIEHIGSTAVPRLGGKGIVDILIGINKKDLLNIKNILQKHKYSFPIGGDKKRLYVEKDYRYKGQTRRVHLQIVPKNSKEWNNPIKIREHLKKDKNKARKYAELKKKAVKISKGKGKIYKNYKKSFLNKLK